MPAWWHPDHLTKFKTKQFISDPKIIMYSLGKLSIRVGVLLPLTQLLFTRVHLKGQLRSLWGGQQYVFITSTLHLT